MTSLAGKGNGYWVQVLPFASTWLQRAFIRSTLLLKRKMITSLSNWRGNRTWWQLYEQEESSLVYENFNIPSFTSLHLPKFFDCSCRCPLSSSSHNCCQVRFRHQLPFFTVKVLMKIFFSTGVSAQPAGDGIVFPALDEALPAPVTEEVNEVPTADSD